MEDNPKLLHPEGFDCGRLGVLDSFLAREGCGTFFIYGSDEGQWYVSSAFGPVLAVEIFRSLDSIVRVLDRCTLSACQQATEET